MANLLDRFSKEVIGSDFTIYDYLSKITASGDFKRIRDIDVIINSWNNILTTPRRTFLFDPNYGSDLHKIIFEPLDDNTIERIKIEVEQQLMLYDNRATIEDMEVLIKPNGKGFELNILAEFEGKQGSLSLSFDDTTVVRIEGEQ